MFNNIMVLNSIIRCYVRLASCPLENLLLYMNMDTLCVGHCALAQVFVQILYDWM